MIDTPLLKRIKMIQANEAKNWKGLPVEWVSRPGTFRLFNLKTIFRPNIKHAIEQENI